MLSHESYHIQTKQFPGKLATVSDFLGFDAMCCAEFAGKLLKSRCNYVIIELELYRLSQKKSENVQKCRS